MTTSPVRGFNSEGIEQFRAYLAAVKAGKLLDAPDALALNPNLTEILEPRVVIDKREFASTLEMLKYLHPIVNGLTLPDKFYNPGLYSWLSAFYFDVVCPIIKGKRKPGEEARHIPPTDRNFRDYSVHLIASPLRMYDSHSQDITILLFYTPPHQKSEFLREIAQVQELAMNPGILEAITLLYWDNDKLRPKTGSVSKNKPGTLRRFVAVMNQFNVTYDLFAMTGHQIVELLPKGEFGRWLAK